MTEPFDRDRIASFLRAIADGLDGDWLLIGGALVALWLEPRRTTEDLDLVPVSGSREQRLALMSFTEELDLPVEAVNTAADFFLNAIDGWKAETELLIAGSRGRILRPTPTLFILLKMRRLSEQDLADCASAIRAARERGLLLDLPRLTRAIVTLPQTADPHLRKRREALLCLLAGG
ncbi:MAG: hypothetical protein IT186_07525 [Acidobacteria bacterium]|nr:hypothetical protein [Acidobacteriota bacterium]MCG3192846.1 hypothetical protein [Thermoanaerobaculia bacterium]MCK6681236.1 hypothetical protein [Thermoanaerobaculia bacterium]